MSDAQPQPQPPDDELFPKLHPKIEQWIKEKMKAYHARKASSKPTQQYGYGLRYTAAERVETCAQNQIEGDKANDIVIASLGKSGALFQALVTQALREREADLLAERRQREAELIAEKNVAMAKAEAQAAMIANHQEDREQMRAMVNSLGTLMERISGQLENVTKLQLQITQQKPKEASN